ncbi:fimbrial protein [Pseudomonas fluorescens]|uniref:fimbrial protein n=1 Tax=Pseudomonas fluorescens TaxID=294 RepID=UPI003F5A548C
MYYQCDFTQVSCPALVQLDKLTIHSFPFTDSTNEAATFQISVTCEKSYASYKINYDISDIITPSNRSENLTLRNTPDQASGIQLQILDSNSSLKFGPQTMSSSNLGL